MRRVVAALLLALAACTHAPPRPTPTELPADAGPEDRVAALAAELAQIRELPLREQVPVVLQSPEAFRKAFRAKTAREAKLNGADRAEYEAEWVAFGFVAPAGSAPDAGVAVDQVGQVAGSVFNEQIAGYYDEFEHQMHLPEAPGAGPSALRDAMQDFLVAHELEHALQDQHFGFERLTRAPAKSEERLAINAVYEGDAMLAGLLYLARRGGVPEERILQLTDTQLERGELTGMGKALESAPPILRERLIFPYAAGFHLCLALYRTGGFALVNQLFSHPPQTAEQLLHPEKYVAGEPAVPVKPPDAPPGFTAVDSGTLGELGARVVLLEAMGQVLARHGVEGWGGDAYTVSSHGKQLALEWVTTWDDPLSARKFEAAMHQAADAWRAGPPEATAPGWTISGSATIRREGDTVVVVRGLPEAQASARMPELFARVGVRPPAVPPLGALALAGPAETGAVLPDGAWGSEPWSLYVPTPSGFRAISDPPTSTGIALMVIHGDPIASGTFGVSNLAFSKARAAKIFEVVAAKQGPGTSVVDTGTIDLGWARGEQQELRSGERHTRTVVAPACQGRATWVLQINWIAPADERALMEWLSGFAPHGPQPACAQLH